MMTRQEKNIFDLLILGLSSKEIANKLFISVHTVESHRKHIRKKFGVHSTAQLVVKVYQNALALA
jgi:DNA-binding CsgD family transcriptional regulator